MIDMGLVTEIACQMPRCLYPGQQFAASQAGETVRKFRLSLDHIIPTSVGGPDRPENIRIAHVGCNSAASNGAKRGLAQTVSNWLKRHRHLQMTAYGIDPYELEDERLAEYLRLNFLALHTETSEMLQELNWRPWRDGNPKDFNRTKVIEEAVDIFFFIANILNGLGIRGPEFLEAYIAKYGENEARMLARRLHASASRPERTRKETQ